MAIMFWVLIAMLIASVVLIYRNNGLSAWRLSLPGVIMLLLILVLLFGSY